MLSVLALTVLSLTSVVSGQINRVSPPCVRSCLAVKLDEVANGHLANGNGFNFDASDIVGLCGFAPFVNAYQVCLYDNCSPVNYAAGIEQFSNLCLAVSSSSSFNFPSTTSTSTHVTSTTRSSRTATSSSAATATGNLTMLPITPTGTVTGSMSILPILNGTTLSMINSSASAPTTTQLNSTTTPTANITSSVPISTSINATHSETFTLANSTTLDLPTSTIESTEFIQPEQTEASNAIQPSNTGTASSLNIASTLLFGAVAIAFF